MRTLDSPSSESLYIFAFHSSSPNATEAWTGAIGAGAERAGREVLRPQWPPVPAPATWLSLEVVLMWMSGRGWPGAEAEDIPQGIAASGGRVEGGPDSPGERGKGLSLHVPAHPMGSCYWKRFFLRLTLPPCILSPLLFCLLSLTPLPFFFPLKFPFHLWHHLYHPPPHFFPLLPPIPSHLLFSPSTSSSSLRFSFTHWPPLSLELPILSSWSRKSSHPLQEVST